MLAKIGLALQIQVPRVFRRSKVLLRMVPPSLGHVPAYVAEVFKDPEFCKNVAGLERMLRVRARVDNNPGVCNSSAGFVERDLVADSQIQGVVSGQCSDEHSACEFSSGLVEDSVVPGASDLQKQVPAIQIVQKLVLNIVSDPVFPNVAGDLESNKRDLEDGILAVRASSPATAGDGNRSRLLEVIESVFPCLVTRFANSPNSSSRVSSHARARALCFAVASAFLSDPPLCTPFVACTD